MVVDDTRKKYIFSKTRVKIYYIKRHFTESFVRILQLPMYSAHILLEYLEITGTCYIKKSPSKSEDALCTGRYTCEASYKACDW
jgi:hypothetical protein